MQTFDEAVAEFVKQSEELLHQESPEDRPAPAPAPLDPSAVPVPSLLQLTEPLIRRYAGAMGEDNPLYVDPAYGERSWLGSQICPGTILIHVRYPGDHGAQLRGDTRWRTSCPGWRGSSTTSSAPACGSDPPRCPGS